MNALQRLDTTLASLRNDVPTVRVGGKVCEVTPTHYRVAGLSRFVRLGELIGLEIGGELQLGEVVRIDADGVTRLATMPSREKLRRIAPSFRWPTFFVPTRFRVFSSSGTCSVMKSALASSVSRSAFSTPRSRAFFSER